VVTVLDPQASPVTGDADRLQQIIWNLLSNAIKFTPKGGRVLIRLERINSHVEIIVSDTGVGISPEFLPHVFDRFRQADGSITRSYGGLGLGLAIVRHLVELHGGTVSADSRPGEGATFSVQLPVISVQAVEIARTPEQVHPTAGGDVPLESATTLDGVRVLVVDDQQDTIEVLTAVLGQCGAEVRAAMSAAEALETLQEWKPDVLVSDIGMPGEDGYELIRKVRALQPEQGKDTPAVALTAHARTEDRLRALSAGFEMHVPKPVEPAELVMVIMSLTRHKTGERVRLF
jgi:CheY-like chemotaxis protein